MGKWERKFGKYAIKNLSLVLILCYAVGYLIGLINENFLMYLTLDPYQILHGQIWRIFTWIIVPPGEFGLLTLITLYFYYSIGTSLERTWGTWRYNVYLLSGMLFTVLGSFVWLVALYLMTGGMSGEAVAYIVSRDSRYFSTYYVNMSIFLAFAATFPDVQVLLMFVIPIKVKVLGIIYALILVWDFIAVRNLAVRIAIGSSLLNFVIFFFTTRSHMHMSPKQVKRRAEFKHEIKRNPKITKHKCAICGRTDEDDPTLEFRFCSKCNGNYEYCQNHLFTHTHVK
ncbi:MAG: rhomboid family intramembrane serine protease [Eubacterium sp.]|nr:rhomboid family intramembrane serine protease [Eubacterium sp.]MCM1305361.1 rhomboid family intramembrane serine protease [Butyrivibrio sp.]MCM1344731.1 rhomboid family intramembrane serine protease [Muribaculaceae bacterium]MCM1412010.1 rhomboid family intramembrane serine protease [Lachnospiraceae bacterium]